MPIELRQRIVYAYKMGMTVNNICFYFDLKPSAVYNLIRLEKETGGVTPNTHRCGRKPVLSPDDVEFLRQLIECDPDITLEEMREELSVDISLGALCRYVKDKLGFNHKKKHPCKRTGSPGRSRQAQGMA